MPEQEPTPEVVAADVATDEPRRQSVPVRGRPDYEVTFDLDIRYETQMRRQIAFSDDAYPGGINEVMACANLIADQAVCIQRSGLAIVDDGGHPLTFRDWEMQAALGVMSAEDAVRRLFVHDGDLLRLGNDLLRLSGYPVAALAPYIDDIDDALD